MKNFHALIFATAVFMIAGCTQSVRFSNDEIKDFNPAVQERIKNSEVSVGMTKLQVRYAWGGPESIIVLPPNPEGKERVEWLYKKLFVFKTRLIFTDDRLTEIISTEPGIDR